MDLARDEIKSARPDISGRTLSIVHALVAEIGRHNKAALGKNNIHTSLCDDGSMVVEWILPDRRAGFGIELDPADDGWFYASRGHESDGGSMATADVCRLVRRMLT